jgi:hypothetical protein
MCIFMHYLIVVPLPLGKTPFAVELNNNNNNNNNSYTGCQEIPYSCASRKFL